KPLISALCYVDFDPILLGDQRCRIEFELAKLAGEGHVLLVGHRLVAEAQHEVDEPGGTDRVAVTSAERLAHVDPGNVGAQPCRNRSNGDAHRRYSAASRASTP